MEPIASFQGLATGINFRDLVSKIIEAESRPVILMARTRVTLDHRTTAWADFRSRVSALEARAGALANGTPFESLATSVSGGGTATAVSAAATTSAVPGTYSVEVLQLATHEKVGSGLYADKMSALGVSGEFLVGGRPVSVSSQDSLADVAIAINLANEGLAPSGVVATVVGSGPSGYRIVLASEAAGAAGIDMADESAGVLRSLGFIDTTVAVKQFTSDGAISDGFKSSTADIATLLDLKSPPASGAVTIGSLSVTIDLAADSLDAIASAINLAASGAGSPISAQLVQDTDPQGRSIQRLDVSGTTNFVDAGGILEVLGVVQAGRSAVAQEVRGAAFTDGNGVTQATGTTVLTALWAGGASAGVQVGDTLSLQGTRGDGSAFTKTFAVSGSSTYQDLVVALNDATDAFGSGARTGTVAISAGQLVVTDVVVGNSLLGLTVITNNEGGGSLDFGTFSASAVGRKREISAGLDAQLLVDGVFHSRSKNVVSDVLDGVTLTLSDVTSSPVTVELSRDVSAVVNEIEAFVKAFNSVSEFVAAQAVGAGTANASGKPPLAGENLLRSMRVSMRNVLESTVLAGVSSFSRLAEIGVEVNRNGTYDVDRSALSDAISADLTGVRRLFAQSGSSDAGSLRYLAGGDAVVTGSYEVVVSAPATRATAASVGFGGAYVDDGTADTMTIAQSDTGASYSIQLANGMTLTQIVDALNAELGLATRRTLHSASPLKSDAIGTNANESTLLQDLHDSGGASLGVANGDVLTISGVGNGGGTFYRSWPLADVATQDLGDLRAEIASAIGGDVVIDFQGGLLTATAVSTGSETFTLSVTSDNAGGGSFALGSIDTVEAGRRKSSVRVSAAGGELSLAHDDYGAASGFSVSYAAGGADGSGSLGLAAGEYTGTDVTGTIGGATATGAGQLLTGDSGTAVDGLIVQFTGTVAGAAGAVTFSRGIGAMMESITTALLGDADGSIQGIIDRLDTQKDRLDGRIAAFDARMDFRAETLNRRFTALEEAMSKAQQQMSWLQAQLGSLVSNSSTR